MTPLIALEGIFLAALWGASFLFMRIGAPEFGPAPMMSVRVVVAMLVLLPILLVTQGACGLRTHFSALCVVGITKSAIPFTVLVWGKVHFDSGDTGWAILAALAACGFYGFGANYARRRLPGVDSLTTATGSMFGASLFMSPLAHGSWPAANPGAAA